VDVPAFGKVGDVAWFAKMRYDEPSKADCDRRLATDKGKKGSLRCLKRQPSDVVLLPESGLLTQRGTFCCMYRKSGRSRL
jgi:hypothetical protein